MLGFVPPWRRTPRLPECQFCCPSVPLARVRAGQGSVDKGLDIQLMVCPSCDARYKWNSVSSKVEPVGPSLPSTNILAMNSGGEATPGRPTCMELEQGKLHFEDPLLCRTCQHHQSIIVQLLSAYEPSISSDRSDTRGFVRKIDSRSNTNNQSDIDSDNEQDEYWLKLRQYREDLEKRYPLCALCRSRVQERLKTIEYRVRTQRLFKGNRRDVLRESTTRRISWFHRMAVMADILVVQTVFSIISMAAGRERLWTSIPLVQTLHLASPTFWYLLVVVPIVGNFSMESIKNGWRPAMSLFVALLRVAYIRILFAPSPSSPFPSVTESFGNSTSLHHIVTLLIVATYGALYLQYGRWKHKRKIISNQAAIIAKQAEMSKSFVPTRGLTQKLASLDTALDHLGPETPLDTRFTDLNRYQSSNHNSNSKNNRATKSTSPFEVPSLYEQNSLSTVATPRTPVTMRPSAFDGVRQNGLERVMEGFKLDEGKRQHITSPSSSSSIPILREFFDQFVLTVGFGLARLVVTGQVPLIVVLLVISLSMRNALWPRLPHSLRMIINVLVLVRLIWLAALFNSEKILPITLSRAITLSKTIALPRIINQHGPVWEIAIDVFILLTR